MEVKLDDINKKQSLFHRASGGGEVGENRKKRGLL
jgi:hypothetical protein